MQDLSRHLVQHAAQLGRVVRAKALVIYTDAIRHDDELRRVLLDVAFPTLLVTRSRQPRGVTTGAAHTWITIPDAQTNRAVQLKASLLVCVSRDVLRQGDRVVFVGGAEGSGVLDMVFVFDVGTVPELFSLQDVAAFSGSVSPEVFERVLALATQLAVEGREGRSVGTLFVVGDSDRVMAQSRSLVLNPFLGHPEAVRNILDPAVEETIKEFSVLDGAFVVRDDGVVLSAGTQLVPSVPYSELPGGLGTRHAAAAGITASTEALAVCISQSTGTVTIFKSGRIVTSLQRSAAAIRVPARGERTGRVASVPLVQGSETFGAAAAMR